jgi:hypothetical protein
MRALSEFTTAELNKCRELTSGLLALSECLPDRLATYLDTFGSNLQMEQEDRAESEAASRQRVQASVAPFPFRRGISETATGPASADSRAVAPLGSRRRLRATPPAQTARIPL